MLSAWVITAICLVSFLSFFMTGVVRSYTLKMNILDIPNARSSHSVATPRGGGLSIALLFLPGVAVLAVAGIVPVNLAMALCGGGLLVAVVGWVDDCRSLRASVRAFFHLLAAIWAVFWLGGLPDLNIGTTVVSLGFTGSILAVIGVVWFINLYNFMDGIDGLAASEAVYAGLVGGALSLAAGLSGLAATTWLLAAASAGFLLWNWPPAKIFMGDVGSGLLGFSFAVIALGSEKAARVPLLSWLLLLGVFIVDATATLLRRIWRGERWYEPHRSHAYQLAVQAGYSHKQVTLLVLGLNVGLAALAFISWRWSATMLWVVLAGSLGLVILQNWVVSCFADRHMDSKGQKQVARTKDISF